MDSADRSLTLALAVRENAEWCDAVCRSHSLTTRFDDDLWTCRQRTPPLYPDAITLVSEVVTERILNDIDPSPGCSIKDSYASVQLRPLGFRVLFDAEWIVRAPPDDGAATHSSAWWSVEDRATFERWLAAWCRHGGAPGVLPPSLLDDDSVTILGDGDADQVTAGAILHSSAAAVGISNLFTDPGPGSLTAGWRACAAAAGALCQGRPLVGYETGEGLAAALAAGFDAAGPLRVWIS